MTLMLLCIYGLAIFLFVFQSLVNFNTLFCFTKDLIYLYKCKSFTHKLLYFKFCIN